MTPELATACGMLFMWVLRELVKSRTAWVVMFGASLVLFVIDMATA